MKDDSCIFCKMKNQKGFIQIPFLIAIIAGVLVLGGGGYLGIRQYQNNQAEKVEQKKITQEKEAEAHAKADAQQQSLEAAQQEIEKLKQEGTETKKKQNMLEQQVKTQTNQPEIEFQGLSITSAEIAPHLTETPLIICYDEDLNMILGSGSIWNLPKFGNSVVITNRHVVEEPDCVAQTYNGDNPLSNYDIHLRDVSRWNNATDISVFPLLKKEAKQTVNSNISKLPLCSIKMAVGSPVIVIGFPAFGVRMVDLGGQGFLQRVASQIVTNGIISGHDTTVVKPKGKLPYQNYFISATVDSGNSGGIAFAKDKNGLCVLGVPTWLTIGNYQTQGLVQNIHNVFYVE